MKGFVLTWDPNPCGLIADSYSVYWRMGYNNPRWPDKYHTFSAEEIVEGGELIAEKITDTKFYHQVVGYDNNYVVVAHKEDKDGIPRVIALNLDATVE